MQVPYGGLFCQHNVFFQFACANFLQHEPSGTACHHLTIHTYAPIETIDDRLTSASQNPEIPALFLLVLDFSVAYVGGVSGRQQGAAPTWRGTGRHCVIAVCQTIRLHCVRTLFFG
jgi:hypothetical protein